LISLTSSFTQGVTHLGWYPGKDLQSSSRLSYNIRVGSTPGGQDIVSPLSLTNGFRLVPRLGNAQMRTNTVLNLPPGTYYWSVQAIDTAFAGGPFAMEASFVVPPPTLNIWPAGTNAVISWQPVSPGWILQENLNLASGAWSNSPTGATNPAVIPASLPAKFYRLFKP
jgi:hypothetical protein